MEHAVQGSVDAGKTGTGYRWVVLALIFVIYMLAAADRANIGIVLPHLQAEFGLDNTQAGLVVSLFFLAYGVGQVPSAFLVKRFGVRRVLPLSVLLTSVMTGLHGLVGSLAALKLVRAGLGAAEAPIANSAMTSINNWFPAHEKGTAAGIFMASTKFGPVLVPPIGAVIILSLGWHWVFLLFAIPGFLLPLAWLRLVPDDPAASPHVSADEARKIAAEAPGTRLDVPAMAAAADTRFGLVDRLVRTRAVRPIATSAQAFASWNVWGHALSYFVLTGTMNVILAWMPKYLAEVQGFSIMKTGFVASAPFVGAVLGNLAGGWISDRLLGKRRKPLMMTSCLATVAMMHALRYAPEDTATVVTLLFATGFLLSLGFSLYGIFSAGLTTRDTFPIATSILNTCGQLGGAALPFLTGVILDRGGWDDVFFALSVAAAAAFLLLATIVEPRGFTT